MQTMSSPHGPHAHVPHTTHRTPPRHEPPGRRRRRRPGPCTLEHTRTPRGHRPRNLRRHRLLRRPPQRIPRRQHHRRCIQAPQGTQTAQNRRPSRLQRPQAPLPDPRKARQLHGPGGRSAGRVHRPDLCQSFWTQTNVTASCEEGFGRREASSLCVFQRIVQENDYCTVSEVQRIPCDLTAGWRKSEQ